MLNMACFFNDSDNANATCWPSSCFAFAGSEFDAGKQKSHIRRNLRHQIQAPCFSYNAVLGWFDCQENLIKMALYRTTLLKCFERKLASRKERSIWDHAEGDVSTGERWQRIQTPHRMVDGPKRGLTMRNRETQLESRLCVSCCRPKPVLDGRW